MKNLPIEDLRKLLTEKDNLILDLYLERKTQKYICDKAKCTRGYIDNLVKKFNLTRFRDRKLYYCNESFLTTENPKIWYFLGLFASDGNIYNSKNTERVQFTMKDKDALDSVVTILGYSGPINTYVKNNKTYYQVMISYPPLNTFIKSIFGEVSRKTDTIKFPSIYFREHLQLFLRGFIDGDGCFRKTKTLNRYNFSIYCKSTRFITSLYKVLKYITRSHIGLYKNHYIELSNIKANTLLYKFLYQSNLDLGIKRKQERALQHIKKYTN